MRVLLIGHPVAHSISPAMQNAAFAARHLPHRYEAVDVEETALATTLAELRRDDCLGANVTVPYKRAVAAGLDRVDPKARLTGAVNTIVNADGHLTGHNTDIDGAWHGLLEPAIDAIRGGRVLLLGAGGGGRAVLVAMTKTLPEGPAEVAVLARRPIEAAEAAEFGRGLGLSARARPWPELGEALRRARVVVNCTPLGLYGEDPLEGLPLDSHVVLDLAYRRGGTPLVQRARSDGLTAYQGDQMLLRQGARSFWLWTGAEAPIEAMQAAVAQEMA